MKRVIGHIEALKAFTSLATPARPAGGAKVKWSEAIFSLRDCFARALLANDEVVF